MKKSNYWHVSVWQNILLISKQTSLYLKLFMENFIIYCFENIGVFFHLQLNNICRKHTSSKFNNLQHRNLTRDACVKKIKSLLYFIPFYQSRYTLECWVNCSIRSSFLKRLFKSRARNQINGYKIRHERRQRHQP